MADIEERMTVARPPEDVRAFILDAGRATNWQGNLTEYEQTTPGPAGEGTRSRGVSEVVGMRMEWTAEIVDWGESGWTWRSVESEPPWEIRWTIEPVDDGTEVIFEQSSPSLEGMKGMIARKILGAQAVKDLEQLREMVEAG